jgi:alkyl hydroperoxide reductase subunit F
MGNTLSVLDTVIIGAGPAGMTAAIYAKRKGLVLTIIADRVGGQMGTTGEIENYPGFDVIRGQELSRKMREQMLRLGIEPVLDRITGVERTDSGYRLVTRGGRSIEARSVIVASGAHWREIGVPGEKEYISKGVSYCTTCDAPLFSGMDVAVVGGGNAAAEAVIELAGIASRVYMIVRSRLKCDEMTTVKIRKNNKVTVLEGYGVVRISGTDFVESITVKSGDGKEETLPVGGVFVEIGQDPNSGFIKNWVKTNDRGEIEIDEFCRTSMEGIYACGDVTDVPQKQVIVAAGEGAKAAMSVFTYLSGLKEKDVQSCAL